MNLIRLNLLFIILPPIIFILAEQFGKVVLLQILSYNSNLKYGIQ